MQRDSIFSVALASMIDTHTTILCITRITVLATCVHGLGDLPDLVGIGRPRKGRTNERIDRRNFVGAFIGAKPNSACPSRIKGGRRKESRAMDIHVSTTVSYFAS